MHENQCVSFASVIGDRSKVRLIIEDQHNRVLLARYSAHKEDLNDVQNEGRKSEELSYWSFIGLPEFRAIGHESGVAETIVRIAHRQLGIRILDLERVVRLSDDKAEPPKLHRVYYWARVWDGEPPAFFSVVGDALNLGLYDWVVSEGLGHYISQYDSENAVAMRAWRKLRQRVEA